MYDNLCAQILYDTLYFLMNVRPPTSTFHFIINESPRFIHENFCTVYMFVVWIYCVYIFLFYLKFSLPLKGYMKVFDKVQSFYFKNFRWKKLFTSVLIIIFFFICNFYFEIIFNFYLMYGYISSKLLSFSLNVSEMNSRILLIQKPECTYSFMNENVP